MIGHRDVLFRFTPGRAYPGSTFLHGADTRSRVTRTGGIEKVTAANRRRLNWHDLNDDGIYEMPGELFERDVYNRKLNSEDATAWTNNGNAITVTADQYTAPDGTTTADKLEQSAVTGAGRNFRSEEMIGAGFSAGDLYTHSIWVRIVSGTDTVPQIKLGSLEVIGTEQTFSGPDISAQITQRWKRFDFTRTIDASATSAKAFISISWDSEGAANDVVFAIWGWQVELNDGPTSYIATAGAAVQRLGSSLDVPLGFELQDLTVYADWVHLATEAGNERILLMGDTTAPGEVTFGITIGSGVEANINDTDAVWYSSVAGAALVAGDHVRAVAQLDVAGSRVRAIRTVNGGDPVDGGWQAGPTIAAGASLAGPLQIAHWNSGTDRANISVFSAKVLRGIVGLTEARHA